MTDTNKMAQYVANWQDERNGAALYRAISEVEKNPQLKSVYQRLAEAEERHSCFWEAKLRAAGQLLPSFKLNWRMRTLIFLARRFGPAFVLPNIEPLEQIDSHKYDTFSGEPSFRRSSIYQHALFVTVPLPQSATACNPLILVN